jgi:hypothetical protein
MPKPESSINPDFISFYPAATLVGTVHAADNNFVPPYSAVDRQNVTPDEIDSCLAGYLSHGPANACGGWAID